MTVVPTIRDLFIPPGATAAVRMPPLPEDLSSLLTGFEWRGLGEHVPDLLGTAAIDILLAGWQTHDELATQLRETANDPTRTMLVHLAPHRLESTQAPSLELKIHGRRMMQLAFRVDLTFEIDVVELTVRAGRVSVVRTGEVHAQGTVKVFDTAILVRTRSPLQLPAKIVLAGPSGGHRLEAAEDETTAVYFRRDDRLQRTPGSAPSGTWARSLLALTAFHQRPLTPIRSNPE